MIYYKQGTGTYVVTAPRPWAWQNRNHFPGYDFINHHPTVDQVEDYLIKNFAFRSEEYKNDLVTVIYNPRPNPGI
jgi:hypothetical protein